MAWTYEQSTGLLRSADGLRFFAGYSGHGEGKNNPALDHVPNVGPIPRGRYAVTGILRTTTTHGPNVLVLEPLPGTDTHGRSGFLMHGDSIAHPGEASEGCIIQGPAARMVVWDGPDHEVEVVS